MSILKIFILNFVGVLTNKRKYIEQNFHSVAGVIPQECHFWLLGVKNLSVGICNGAPWTEHSSLRDMLQIQYSKNWVRGQGHSESKMVHNTPPSQDAPTHQIWDSYLK